MNQTTYTSELTVEERHLAINMGSGDLPVLATPALVALMENAAMLAVAPQLPEGSSTVGSYIQTSHLHPTPLGGTVRATATLVSQEGRKLTFTITAEDDKGIVGEARHERFIIDRQRFMAKLN